jgi:hypothetical protein
MARDHGCFAGFKPYRLVEAVNQINGPVLNGEEFVVLVHVGGREFALDLVKDQGLVGPRRSVDVERCRRLRGVVAAVGPGYLFDQVGSAMSWSVRNSSKPRTTSGMIASPHGSTRGVMICSMTMRPWCLSMWVCSSK